MKSSRRGMFLSGGGSGGGNIRRQSLTVTANGTYTAPSGVAYTPVIVNVPTPTPPTPPTPIVPESGVGLGDVNFIDYDGTILYSYSKDEFLASTALPPKPSHPGLVAQGWNYTSAQAKLYVEKYGCLDVGHNYITESGDTEIDIEISPGRTNPILGICPNGTVTIDWGDGSPTETATGTSVGVAVNKPHTYAPGSYTIKITPADGTKISCVGTTYYSTLFHGGATGSNSPNYAYNNAVKAVRLGTGFESIESFAFCMMTSLKYVTVPKGVGAIVEQSFKDCRNLTGFVLPQSCASIGFQAFLNCASLRMVSFGHGLLNTYGYSFGSCTSLMSATLPFTLSSVGANMLNGCNAMERCILPDETDTVRTFFAGCLGITKFRIPVTLETIPAQFFNGCISLDTITVPSGVTTIDQGAFKDCRALSSINIPDGVTQIKIDTFTNCVSVTRFVLPASVTQIASYAFSNCYSLAELDLSASDTKITLGNTNAFLGTPSDMVIKVKNALLASYRSDNFWGVYQNQIVGV